MALCFIEPELLPLEVLHCRNRNSCGLEDLDRMIFIYELEQYPLEVQYMYTGRAKVNFLRQGFRKLSSDRHTQTDEQDRNYILCRFVGDQNGFLTHSVFDSLLYLRISLFDSTLAPLQRNFTRPSGCPELALATGAPTYITYKLRTLMHDLAFGCSPT